MRAFILSRSSNSSKSLYVVVSEEGWNGAVGGRCCMRGEQGWDRGISDGEDDQVRRTLRGIAWMVVECVGRWEEAISRRKRDSL